MRALGGACLFVAGYIIGDHVSVQLIALGGCAAIFGLLVLYSVP